MNQKKAKALRRISGFVPSAKRAWKIQLEDGNIFWIPGTCKAVGPRRTYQDAKQSASI